MHYLNIYKYQSNLLKTHANRCKYIWCYKITIFYKFKMPKINTKKLYTFKLYTIINNISVNEPHTKTPNHIQCTMYIVHC